MGFELRNTELWNKEYTYYPLFYKGLLCLTILTIYTITTTREDVVIILKIKEGKKWKNLNLTPPMKFL